MIPEHLLQEIWKDPGSFLMNPLTLSDGSRVEVLQSGVDNTHRGGPDFLGARIAIDNVAVSGDVEIHRSPELWHVHQHGGDARYSNVILHVVLEAEGGEAEHPAPPIPTLVLRDNLVFDRRDLWEALFRRLYDRSPELPCFPLNLQVPMRFKHKVLEKFGEARLDELIDRVSVQNGDVVTEAQLLERTYQLTMDALGYAQNRIPFRELSALLPLERLRFVRKMLAGSRHAFEALYFGIAGLIPKPSLDFDSETNEYILELSANWSALQVSLPFPEVLAESDWAFFRIRPANTPYRRLALAALLAAKYFSREDWNFRDDFFHVGPVTEMGDSPFWEYGSSFSSRLDSPQILLGDERRSAFWLNVVLPARIARLRLTGGEGSAKSLEAELRKSWGDTRTQASAKYLKTISEELLESESVKSVRSEQGALLLKRNFCDKSRCSKCPVGSRLIEKGWNAPGLADTRE